MEDLFNSIYYYTNGFYSVELDSYLSRKKLYGVISDVDDLSLTLTHTSKNSTIEGADENHNLYIPINSIKSIKKL